MQNHREGPGPTPIASPTEELANKLERIGALVSGCHKRMGSPLAASDLDEVIQETSLAAWERWASFRGESDVETWLYGIARYTILRYLRQRRQICYVESELSEAVATPADPGPGPGTQVDTGVARIIDLGLVQSGTTVAAICRARAVDGHTFVRISSDLRVSEANVKARFYRSLPGLRRRLRTLWEDSGA